MKIIIFEILLAFLSLVNANRYSFKVISILGQGSSLGVKYGDQVQPLVPFPFPLFIGSIETQNLKEYKYVALDESNNVIDEEDIVRTYSNNNNKINEVYNRTTKENIEIPTFPQPFKPMFKMGSPTYKPFPNNTIYNVYAECDKDGYADLTSRPFLDDEGERNDKEIDCVITIVSPEDYFQSSGTIHIIGYGSRLYKKLSWTLKFGNKNKFLGRKAVKMRAMASDPSLIREKLTAEIYKAVGIPVQEGTFARFFINGDNYGLYLMNDNLNARWIGAYVHGNEEGEIGAAYQLDSSHPDGPFADLRYLGEDYLAYSSEGTYRLGEYNKKLLQNGGQAGAWKPLIDFIKLYQNWVKTYKVDHSDNAIDALLQFFNLESMLRLLAVESLILAVDNFWLVMSNSDLYYNPERKNYQILPFDFDQVMYGSKGNILIDPENYVSDCLNWVNYDEKTFEHYFTNNLMSHPQVKERYDIILAKISHEIFTVDKISKYVEAVSNLIREDVQWNFDLVEKLSIPYDGIVKHYTMEDFEKNLIISDQSKLLEEDDEFSSFYDLMDWVEIRGDYCRAYTSNVNTTNNTNISDNAEIEVSGVASISSGISFSVNRIILSFIFTMLIFFFFL